MGTKIGKYIRIYLKLLKYNAMVLTEYRVSFIIQIFVEVGYFISTVLALKVIFWNVNEIAGWNFYEIAVLLGINQIFSEILLGAFFIMNIRELPRKITTGELDLTLLKPLNSQFSVSLWKPYFTSFVGCVAGICIIFWAFIAGNLDFSIANLVPFLLVFFCGIVIAYSIGMIISTLSFWIINASSLPRVAEETFFMAKNPYSVYKGAWRIIFLLIIPLAFMVSFPTEALLGKVNYLVLPLGLLLAYIFLKLSKLFWSYGLSKYTSAGG